MDTTTKNEPERLSKERAEALVATLEEAGIAVAVEVEGGDAFNAPRSRWRVRIGNRPSERFTSWKTIAAYLAGAVAVLER